MKKTSVTLMNGDTAQGWALDTPGLAACKYQAQTWRPCDARWLVVHVESGHDIAVFNKRDECVQLAAALTEWDWTLPKEEVVAQEGIARATRAAISRIKGWDALAAQTLGSFLPEEPGCTASSSTS